MDITKNISNLIASQFPNVYRDRGEEMVAFLEAYYEFLEQTDGYSEHMNRNMFDVNDIDRTLEEFVSHFKNKYLSEFPYVTFADKRFLIKHINDFYVSKGSEKSVKLLMKMLFGEESEVYYPAQDILKPSDSKWVIPSYIELESSDRAASYVGKRIVGSKSKATAVVDGLVRKRARGKLIDVLYLSELTKDFVDGDYITDNGDLGGAPKVDGSLRDVTIVNGGANYVVGDVVNLTGIYGEKAKGIVTEVINPTDKVNLRIIDGGFGYTLDDNTKIYISTSKLRATTDVSTLKTFDTVYQYTFTASHSYASMVDMVGSRALFKNSSNQLIGGGLVLSATASTVRINHTMIGSNVIGDIATITFDLTTNIPIGGMVDDTISAFIVGVEGQGVGIYYYGDNDDPTNRFIAPSNYVYDQTGEWLTFRDDEGNIYGFSYVEGGFGFSFKIAAIDNDTVVTYNTDLVSDYVSVSLASTNYGFPPVGSETLSTSLATALTFTDATVGRITRLSDFNPGAGYESDPFIVVVNPYLAPSFILDNIITVGLADLFPIRIGDFIKKDVSGGYSDIIGQVKEVTYPEAGVARVEIRMTSYDVGYALKDDLVYFFAPEQVEPKGQGTVISNVKSYTLPPLGINANIEAKVQNAVGTIQSIRIDNSGFGYETGEELEITNLDTNSFASVASAIAIANNSGVGSGYWQTTNSHLNSEKKIRDNYYYQEYSYEIQSGLAIDRYKDIVKNTVHVAGTELFGKVINKSVSEVNPIVTKTSIGIL